ncbi:MAG: 4-hydroxy-tetrahydrodipicolinate reductase [Rhabdochlamydiaceae bacterium]|nr:4-hydroxy-tetrahydrodipicolinate reductase [Rhabdochlamydiaceae bacterium]
MTLHIGLIGATGKVGRQIIICSEKDQKLAIVWKLSSQSDRKNLPPVDVIIDFSSPLALQENLELAQKQKTPIVIGTTGLQTDQLKSLEIASSRIAIFWAPNFSIGIAALVHAIEILSPLLRENFTANITETHHIHKKDAPSGSALAFAKATLTGYPNLPPIESIRLEEIIGEHTISFLGQDEKITLSHEALSREVFAKGALQAAQFVLHKPPKLYGMKDLLH